MVMLDCVGCATNAHPKGPGSKSKQPMITNIISLQLGTRQFHYIHLLYNWRQSIGCAILVLEAGAASIQATQLRPFEQKPNLEVL